MASRKCNATRALGSSPAHSGCPAGGSPSPSVSRRLCDRSGAILGGVGVVDPDGDSSARPGAACYAGSYSDLAQPSLRPEKRIGLCGKTGVKYTS